VASKIYGLKRALHNREPINGYRSVSLGLSIRRRLRK
jgi:hypothetical protein